MGAGAVKKEFCCCLKCKVGLVIISSMVVLTYMKIMKMRMSGFDEGPLVGEISGSEAQLLC